LKQEETTRRQLLERFSQICVWERIETPLMPAKSCEKPGFSQICVWERIET